MSRYIPPSPSEVPARLETWAENWRNNYPTLSRSDRESVIAALASFYYEFLEIHPFIDGNGRLALLLLDEAARELVGQRVSPTMADERLEHQNALNAAAAGQFEKLRQWISVSLI